MKTINDWYKDRLTPELRANHWVAIIFCILGVQLTGNAGQLVQAPVQFYSSQSTGVLPVKGALNKDIIPGSNTSILSPSSDPSLLWSSDNRELKLYATDGERGSRICPVLRDRDQQPFCREFNSRVIGVCGQVDELLIVLASGDVHRLNYALMRANGSLEPIYTQRDSLSLTEAWIPVSNCIISSDLPHIYAVTSQKRVMHFYQQSWRQLQH